MYILLQFWQIIMAIPNMNPLSWFMIRIITGKFQEYENVLLSVRFHFKVSSEPIFQLYLLLRLYV